MDIAVEGSLDVCVPDDALYCLDGCPRVVQQGCVAVPEDMRRCSVQVNGAVDAFHHPAMNGERDGRLAPYDIAETLHWLKTFHDLRGNGDIPDAALCLGRSDEAVVLPLRITDISDYMKHILLQIHIAPLKPQYFAATHTRKEQQGHIPPVHFIQLIQRTDNIPNISHLQRFAYRLFLGRYDNPAVGGGIFLYYAVSIGRFQNGLYHDFHFQQRLLGEALPFVQKILNIFGGNLIERDACPFSV